ncbi:MAG: N-6 DNA methylase [Chitinophagales bacterium]
MALFQKSVLNQYLKQLDKSKVEIAYQKFKAHFHNATIQQQIRDSKEEQYQEGFFRDLFVDVFGFTLNPQPDYNLITEKKNESDSKKADGAILQNGNAIVVIELKGTNTTDLASVAPQAFGYKVNHKGCKYVIISNFEKLRFYIDDKVDFEEFNLFTLTENEFTLLYLCLHIDNIFSDLPAIIKQKSTVKEQDITKQLYKDYSDFKRKLFTDIVLLNPQYDKLILFKKSQKLLDRILFILFAEDRGLLQANTIQTILDEFENLKKLDAYQPLYERFKKHFTYLNNGFKNEKYEVFGYNGGLFANDEILDTILISDNLLQNYTPTLAKYDYETDVDVNILGHIFEHSLNDIEEIQAELDGKEIDKTKTKRKKDGVFYTPKYITKYIVENTVGALCTEKRNEFEVIAENYTPDKRKAKKKELLQKLDNYQTWLLQITIVDPACGSGAFLNQALDFLIQEHKNIDELRAQLLGESLVLPDHEVAILENNIFGVDLNEESVEIARLSLWLRTARKGRKLSSLNNNIKCGNSLIDDVSIAGDKAFNWQKEFSTIFEKGGFDVVIGNPPWGAKIENNQKQYIIQKYSCKKGEVETYVHFIDLSLNYITKNNGLIGLITPNTWYYLDKYLEIRQVIVRNKIENLIELEKNIFEDAPDIVPAIFFIKNSEIQNKTITTYKLLKGKLPKFLIDKSIFIQSNIVINDWSKIENMPFNLLLTSNISNLIEKIKDNISLENSYIVRYGIKTGNNNLYVKKDINSNRDLNWKYCIPAASCVKKYSLNWEGDFLNYGEHLSGYSKNSFERKKILVQYIRKLSLEKRLISTLDIEGKFYPLNNFSFIEKKENCDLEYLLAILNSKLMNFYFSNVFIDYNIKPKYLEKLPIKIDENCLLSEKAEAMLQKNKELQTIKGNVIKLLQSRYATININTKLGNWNELSYKDFCKELEKQKIKLSISEQAELMQYFETEQNKANTIQQTITQTDKEIDTMVYKLYELTKEEIEIIENN